ncbi:MAG: hypothetical protein KGI57_05965 [Hyphomicrobiales bacterium]|nr:hypothetical protein [Hyphomicrobiales bacterium]MDE2017230.1 hypothetical protein [Hyphomicrobiales bacterium]
MARTRVDEGFLKRLAGYGLTTAEILYRMPDHPAVLQTYVWQDYDVAPDYPALRRFLRFWRERLDGPLHSVTVAHSKALDAGEVSFVAELGRLH